MFTGEIQRARSKRPLVITLITIALIAGVLVVVPMPYTVKSSYVLAPMQTLDLLAQRDGVIGEVTATTGSLVARGSLIARYDVSELEKKLPVLEAQLAALEKQKPAKPNPRAKAAFARARAALKAADAALEKAQKAANGKKTPALAAAEKKRQAAAAAVEKATPALTQAELEKKLDEVRGALADAKAGIASASIVAPASGILTILELEQGKPVARDARLATVEDTQKLKAVVKVPAGEALKKGMGVVLTLPSGTNQRVVFDAEPKGDVALAELDNAKGELTVGASGDANIEAAERSLVLR